MCGFSDLPGASWDLPVQQFEDDVLYLEWRAESEHVVGDGIDTFVFADGLIRVQTVRYTLTLK